MGDVYNRKLFQAKARPAREKLAKMAGIMASSPELMQAANQGPKPPTPPMTGGARPMMPPPPAPMMTPPPQPTVPQLPQVPAQTAVAPAPMMQAPAPRPMAPAPMPQQQPVKFDEGGGVNIMDTNITGSATPFSIAIQTGAVEKGISLYEKLKEMYGSEEKAEAVVAEKDKKIDDAQKTGDPKQISNAILEAAEVEPTKENKMDFAANVLNLKDVNDLNEIDNRIAQASLAMGIGKRVGGNTAIAEAVLLGLNNYKQTAAARAEAAADAAGGGFLDTERGKAALEVYIEKIKNNEDASQVEIDMNTQMGDNIGTRVRQAITGGTGGAGGGQQTPESLLAEARSIIERGADPEAVKKRLQEMGVDPGRL